jgi:S-adenosylmethionine:diacylglycerol 3-amino-3-carboxypropyl transferase
MRDLTDKPPAPTPIVTKELLEYLLERYPDRVPSVDATDRQIWLSVGQVAVVRHLQSIFEEQNDNILRI